MHLYAYLILFSLFHCPLLFPSKRNPLPYSSLIIFHAGPGVALLKTNFFIIIYAIFSRSFATGLRVVLHFSLFCTKIFHTRLTRTPQHKKHNFNKKDTDDFGFTGLAKSIWEHISIFYKSGLNGINWRFVIIFACNFTSICTQLKLCKYNS